MYNVTNGKKAIKEWEMTIDHFNDGNWGNSFGKFKLYRSLMGVWLTKKQADPKVPIDEKDPKTYIIVNNDKKIYEEIALGFISALYAQYPVLRIIGFRGLHPRTQGELRIAIQQGIVFGLSNRTILDRITSLTRTGPSISVDASPVSYIVPLEMFGPRGAQTIKNSGIEQYDVINTTEEIEILSKQGNIIVLGKFDETQVPDIDLSKGVI